MRRLSVLVAMAALAAAPAAAAQGDICAGFGAVEIGGSIAEPRVVELSGLAASRLHAGVLWGHNDSGGAAELYAMREDGTALGAYLVSGAAATDWEDMAAGPGPEASTSYLYVGDVGDNNAMRPSVTVYRVPEPAEPPAAPGRALTDGEAIELLYPDGPADAEALLVDPVSGDLVIVTKSYAGRSHVLVAPAASVMTGAPVTMIDAGRLSVPRPPTTRLGLPGTAVTGGDISPDGSIVLLRTYRSVLAYPRAEGQSVAEALASEPCFAPQAEEPQGEAVAFTGDGSAYVTASEGSAVPINRTSIDPPAVATTTTTTTEPATTTTAPVDHSPLSEDPSPTGTVLIVLILLGTAAAVIVWARRSRPPSAAG